MLCVLGFFDFDGQRVNAAGKFVCQNFIDRAVLSNAGHRLKGVSGNLNPEVGLAALAPATMPAMVFRFVNNIEVGRRKSSRQLVGNGLFHAHFRTLGSMDEKFKSRRVLNSLILSQAA